MTTAGTTHAATATLSGRLAAGVTGGLAGGVVFGILMQLMDMMPMVAQLVDSDSVAVGWLVHLVNSALFGAIYVVAFGAGSTPGSPRSVSVWPMGSAGGCSARC